MSLPARDPGEYASSTEFLKEYGRLIIDASNLIEKLGTTLMPSAESRNFTIERIEDPIKVPEMVAEAIGEVNSASIAYDTTPEASSTTLELFGTDKSYRISRSTDTEVLTDTIIDIKPVDAYSAALFNVSGDEKQPHNTETDEEFMKRIHDIPGIDNAAFVRILLGIAQPNFDIDSIDKTTERLAETDLFSPEIYRLLVDSSSINSQAEQSFIEYNFATDDSAALVFSQENGNPSYFQFICTDPNGDPLTVRGTLHKGVELEYPRHAVKKTELYGEVDTVHSFPLSFSEIKYIRQLFQEELESLPATVLIEEELTPQVDTFTSPIGIDEDMILSQIENDQEEARLENSARHDALNDELARLIDEQDNDS